MTRAGSRWGPGEEVRLGVGDPGGGREVGVLDARSGGGAGQVSACTRGGPLAPWTRLERVREAL